MKNLVNTWSVIVLLLCAASATACSETNTTQNTGVEDERPDREFDDDPVTVNNSDRTNNENNTTNNQIEPNNDVPPPEGTWIPESGDFVLKDDQTGSLWNMRGEAFAGPLAGKQLEQLPGFNSFWFAWSTFYNESEVWNRDIVNQSGEIEPTGSCAVPCDEIRLGCGGGRDCIPALDFDGENDRPVAQMVSADDPAAEYLRDTDFVLGVVVDGQARAYSHNVLWWHEIYNDEIGETAFSVSFCPLTGSGLIFAGQRDGQTIDFEVSGNLYNSNLVMVDRQTETLWSQMMLTGVTGPAVNETLTLLPVTETTWQRWREIHPQTLVTGDDQGYSRNYSSYPYGDYRTNDSDTFRPTNPQFDDLYDAKDRTLGLFGQNGTARAYVFVELENFGDRVVVNDELDGQALVLAYDAEHRLALPFKSTVDGDELSFSGAQAP